MFNIHAVNPDESTFASIAWNLWTEGRLGTDLLAGAIPGIEHHVYLTLPMHSFVLAGWLGLWGLSLLSVRALSMFLACVVLGLVFWDGRLQRHRAAWMASVFLLYDAAFDYAGTIGRMDMLAIALTTAAVTVVGIPARKPWHVVMAGLLASGALMTHPLGGAAGLAVILTLALSDRRSLWLFFAGAVPLVLLWLGYICLDIDTFAAQMAPQLSRKASNPHSLIDNGRRFLLLAGDWWPAAIVLWLGGAVGLLLEGRRRLPWLAAAVCLWPAVLFFGEVAYPAYVAPASAVGLACLVRRWRWRWSPALVAVLAVARLAPVAADPPPAAGIDPGYAAYCARIESYLGNDNDVLLGLLPDPWFGLQHRTDLRFRLAPGALLKDYQLYAYVFKADVTVVGGYNTPGFYDVMRNWEVISTRGQKLWVLEADGRMVDYDDVLAERRARTE